MIMVNLWEYVQLGFDNAKGQESLFTLGSGYIHIRGSLEEHLHDAPQNITYLRKPANVTAERFPSMRVKWGTFVPGIYEFHPLLGKEMANLPSFISLIPYVEGEKLEVERSQIDNHQRLLKFRTATMSRRLQWKTRQGAVIEVTFDRFVSAAHPHLSIQKMTLTSDRNTKIQIEAGIDTDVRTSGYDHFTEVNLSSTVPNRIMCRTVLDSGDWVEMLTQIDAAGAEWDYKEEDRRASLTTTYPLQAGQTAVFEKRTAGVSCLDAEPLSLDALLQMDTPYDALYEAHVAVWEARWKQSDVVIEGDDESQIQLQMGIYHLLRAHPNNSQLAIDPKAYAGDAYRGLYFWDTEIYLLPFFLYTEPERAKMLLDFRINTLEGARANAAAYGYSGARYPWEGDKEGIDQCPNWQYRDHEVHVTADIVYALAHYTRATGNSGYLHEHAAEVVRATAQYWLERLDWRKGDTYPSLLGVMGPDEYTPISSNNAYTNRLTAFALTVAAEIETDLVQREQYHRVAAQLPILRRGQLVIQCEEFEQYAEFDFDQVWKDRTQPLAAQVSQERLYRSKVLKQADVLLLMLLFPNEFRDNEVREAWEYYLPYTSHDSSLSPGVHAMVALRLGLMDEAWRFWQQSLAIDAGDGAAEGIHIAAQGINWQMAVLGFGGMQTAMNTDVLTLSPKLPPHWTRLAFQVMWKGQTVAVDINWGQVEVRNLSDKPISVWVNKQEKVIDPGGEQIY